MPPPGRVARMARLVSAIRLACPEGPVTTKGDYRPSRIIAGTRVYLIAVRALPQLLFAPARLPVDAVLDFWTGKVAVSSGGDQLYRVAVEDV